MAKPLAKDREAAGLAGGSASQGIQAATVQPSACFHCASPTFPS